MPRFANAGRRRPFSVTNAGMTGYSDVTLVGRTLSEVRDDQRLRIVLKRAVNSEVAPQALIDSIRERIRV